MSVLVVRSLFCKMALVIYSSPESSMGFRMWYQTACVVELHRVSNCTGMCVFLDKLLASTNGAGQVLLVRSLSCLAQVRQLDSKLHLQSCVVRFCGSPSTYDVKG